MLPQDPVILLSYLNLKLRDNYSSLDALCDDLDEDMQGILDKMSLIGYSYNQKNNQFTAKR